MRRVVSGMYSLGLSSGMRMMMMIFGYVILDLPLAAGTRTGTGPDLLLKKLDV